MNTAIVLTAGFTWSGLLAPTLALGGLGLLFGVLLAVANVTNVVYDIALTRVVSMYVHWFRPKFLRRF